MLQDHILDLTDEIELRKIREDEIIRSHAMDKKHIIDEMEDLKVIKLDIKTNFITKNVGINNKFYDFYLFNKIKYDNAGLPISLIA